MHTQSTTNEETKLHIKAAATINWKRLPTGFIIHESLQGAKKYEVIRPLIGDSIQNEQPGDSFEVPSQKTSQGGSLYLVREVSSAPLRLIPMLE